MHLPNGKANNVVKGMIKDEYNLWKSIMTIVANTMNVNTGSRMGLSFSFNDYLLIRNWENHNSLAVVVMDDKLGGNNTSPNIEYP